MKHPIQQIHQIHIEFICNTIYNMLIKNKMYLFNKLHIIIIRHKNNKRNILNLKHMANTKHIQSIEYIMYKMYNWFNYHKSGHLMYETNDE